MAGHTYRDTCANWTETGYGFRVSQLSAARQLQILRRAVPRMVHGIIWGLLPTDKGKEAAEMMRDWYYQSMLAVFTAGTFMALALWFLG